MLSPLVSIIIPTYNRAHLIGETLDSVLAQTYQNWECIVVDDGSTDKTDELLAEYMAKDSRFQYHNRPVDRLPGGNAARNYGFEVSKGEFIQWFDSDDLMVSEKLEIKVKAILEYNVDFVISKTKYFNRKNGNFKNYDFVSADVNFEMFATDYIKWYTPDMLLTRVILKHIAFNEKLRAGQEHNYVCQLLLKTTHLYFIDNFLTCRRYSATSIQGRRDTNNLHHLQTISDFHWQNYWQFMKIANSEKFNKFSLLQVANAYLSSNNKIKLPLKYWFEFLKIYKEKSIYLMMAIISNMLFARYKRFSKKIE